MASNQSTPQNAPSNNVAAAYNIARINNVPPNVAQRAAQKQKAQTLANAQRRIAGAAVSGGKTSKIASALVKKSKGM